MADEFDELMNMDFNLEDNGDTPVIISGGTKPTQVCKDDFDFPLKESDIPTVVVPEFLEDKDECLANYEIHVDNVMADVKSKLDKLVIFNKTMDLYLIKFVYGLYYLSVYRAWKYKRTNKYDKYSFDKVTGSGTLCAACNKILDNFNNVPARNLLTPLYTIFKYQADLSNYFKAISGRITYNTDLNKLNSVLSTDKYSTERGIVKNIIESVGGSTVGVGADFSKSTDIGIFSASNNMLSLTDKKAKDLTQVVTDFIATVNDISMFFTQEEAKVYVTNRMKEVPMCGNTLEVPTLPEFPDTADNPQYKDVDDSDSEDMLKLKYWMKYASRLSVIGLIPKFWAKGLILPSGLQKVPISWIPLVVIPSKSKISVLFLTINGVIVFPVMWELRMNEQGLLMKDGIKGDNSYLKVGIRGANKKIKSDTGSKVVESLYVEAIDVAPGVTKASPIIVDDLPQFKRLSLSNLPYLSYLNDWCTAAADIMGIAP